jgi:uncharacterized FAD-dependent dehydrogenase
MGFKLLDLKMPTGYTEAELKRKIGKKLRVKEFSYTIEKQSLDARNKQHIRWQIRVGVSSPALPGNERPPKETLVIPRKKRSKHVIVVGSGPAGFFAAYVLLLAGFKVTLLEQGKEVSRRFKDIVSFERSGVLDERSNYAFGEGGAGTFSDGKLTSRTKSISLERGFIFDTYIEAGAPAEISWLAHPHLGSDILRKICKHLRQLFIDCGGTFLFNTKVEDICLRSSKGEKQVASIEIAKGKMEAGIFIFAIGHSSCDTYRMLIRRGVPFRVKSFALGCRVEHRQELINRAQWGCPSLAGVKAAEYRLSAKPKDLLPVYSFCMCPGGKVVPAAAYKGTGVVNGMSNYRRNAPFANAAVVTGLHLGHLLNREPEPLEALDWLENLERSVYDFSGSYKAPACKIADFLQGKTSPDPGESSFPFGLVPADMTAFFPQQVNDSLKAGLKDFCRKLKGFEQGTMLGLESKSSSLVQAVRDKNGKSAAVENLYICGEGSGFAGGIVSSAADGIKAAMKIVNGEVLSSE